MVPAFRDLALALSYTSISVTDPCTRIFVATPLVATRGGVVGLVAFRSSRVTKNDGHLEFFRKVNILSLSPRNLVGHDHSSAISVRSSRVRDGSGRYVKHVFLRV